jgi:hypothetical protein
VHARCNGNYNCSARPDQFSRSSYVDDNSCLLVSSLPSLFYAMTSHRDIYIYEMLRNDYTVPTLCRHRGGMVDPLGCKAGHPLADQPSNQLLDHSIQNHPKPVSFMSLGVTSGSGLTPLNHTIDHTYICIYTYTQPTHLASIVSPARFVMFDFFTRNYNKTFCT